MNRVLSFLILLLLLVPPLSVRADDVKETDVYARIKTELDAVRGIDTHSHLRGPSIRENMLKHQFRHQPPTNSALFWIWHRSYFTGGHRLAPWPANGNFDTWWANAQIDFQNSRARSAYRTLLPVFTDLYGVDFEALTLQQAKELDKRMEKNYENPNWGEEVLCHRANTQIIVVDSFWTPMHIREHYPFTVSTWRISLLLDGFHESEFKHFGFDSPYGFAAKHELPLKTLDDYVAVVDRMMGEAKKAGAVCLKSPDAYRRTLRYDRTPKRRAEEAFGKTRKQLSPAQIKAFEDYMFWRITELAAKHDLPFQIHTGHARIEGSNPMNLVNLIKANRRTKFILFHGGFPWVGESGMIALKYPNVWLDSVWMPVLSYDMGKRAYKEWLDMISSDRIMWGSDMATVEGTYGTTRYTRQCIYEALTEKVVDKELREEDAVRIGRQILRENALKMFPSIRKLVEKSDHIEPTEIKK